MTRRRALWLLIALLLLAIAAVTLVLVEFPSSHPSDSVLSTNLLNHEASFNRLVEMATEDSTALSVANSYVCLKKTDD